MPAVLLLFLFNIRVSSELDFNFMYSFLEFHFFLFFFHFFQGRSIFYYTFTKKLENLFLNEQIHLLFNERKNKKIKTTSTTSYTRNESWTLAISSWLRTTTRRPIVSQETPLLFPSLGPSHYFTLDFLPPTRIFVFWSII